MRTHKAWPLFQELVAKLTPLPRTSYRGISRSPLAPLPSTDPKILDAFQDSGCDVYTEYDACLRLFELHPNDCSDDFDDNLLADLVAAHDVFSRLKSPADYEITRFVRDAFLDDVECLGFDVGYWGGDHFSIICDSSVCPTWHPPQAENFDELARQLQLVNQHFLFSNPDDAARFRSWYIAQDWAESIGELSIIQLVRPA